MSVCFALFDTAIGRCGLAWGPRGIVGVQLPEADAQQTRARVLQRFSQAQEAKPEAEAKRAICEIVALLRGEPCDFSAIALDMNHLPPFHRRVYAAARKLRRGTTTTYGALADEIGARGAARAVGQALARNPFAIIVPCHRVVASDGRMCGFSANGGIETKRRLLTIEGLEKQKVPRLSGKHALASAPQRFF